MVLTCCQRLLVIHVPFFSVKEPATESSRTKMAVCSIEYVETAVSHLVVFVLPALDQNMCRFQSGGGGSMSPKPWLLSVEPWSQKIAPSGREELPAPSTSRET